jgi:hypothetical protein
MTAPNLAAPTTITGKTTYLALANTNETDLLVNAASSNTALRITGVLLVNTSGSAAVDATIKLYSAATSGTGFDLCRTVTVAAKDTIVLLGRDSSVWLQEDRRLTATASASNALTVICSYEEVA